MSEHGTKTRHYRVGIISDVHIGGNTQTDMTYEFLHYNSFGTLIINGDLFDGERVMHRLQGDALPITEMDKRVLDIIYDRLAKRKPTIFIPGNHDRELCEGDFLQRNFRGMAQYRSYVIEVRLQNGIEGLAAVFHGEQFSPEGMKDKMFVEHAHKVSNIVRQIDRAADRRWHALTGTHPGVAGRIRESLEIVRPLTDPFRIAAIGLLRNKIGVLQGVVCGHIHSPEIVERENYVYANSGDWVEHATALVVNDKGNLELIDWLKERKLRGLGERPKDSDPNPYQDSRTRTDNLMGPISRLWPSRGPAARQELVTEPIQF